MPASAYRVSGRTQARKERPVHLSWAAFCSLGLCVSPGVIQLPIPSSEARAFKRMLPSACFIRASVLKAHTIAPHTTDAPGLRLQDSNSSWVHLTRHFSNLLSQHKGNRPLFWSLSTVLRAPSPRLAHIRNPQIFCKWMINKWIPSRLWLTSWNHGITPDIAGMNSSWIKPLGSYVRNEQHIILGIKSCRDWNLLDVNHLIKYLFGWQHSLEDTVGQVQNHLAHESLTLRT